MTFSQKFDTILELKLSGRLAHYRKFYTNASSLSYSIPPRTSICGMVASILEKPRDSYYEMLNSNKLGVSISVKQDTEIRKQFFTMNYIEGKTCVNDASSHKQCRLELLMPAPDKELEWTIHLAFNSNQPIDAIDPPNLIGLAERIENQNLGYGVYLGQRQFKGAIELVKKFSAHDFDYRNESEYVDSAIGKDKIMLLDGDFSRIQVERMPLEQTTEVSGKKTFRRCIRFGDIFSEISGRRLAGKFCDVIELNDTANTRIALL